VFQSVASVTESDEAAMAVEDQSPVVREEAGVSDASRAEDRAFWSIFRERLKLDDPAQPLPTPRSQGNARATLGHPDIWLTVYRTRGWGGIGVFVRFRGVEGRGVWQALCEEKDAINAEIAAAVPDALPVWSDWVESKNAVWVDAGKKETFEPGPEGVERHIAWLVPLTNAFVNAFRPRIRSLLPD
jgi:hypothetical protein